jgi:hypothetical protein
MRNFHLDRLDQRVLLSGGGANVAWDAGAEPQSSIAQPRTSDFAPTSINGIHITLTVRSANQSPTSGTYEIDISKHGHDFVLVPHTAHISSGSGTCGYSKTGVNAGTITFDETSSGISGTISLTFTVSHGGTYKLNGTGGLYQKGVFSY